MIVIHVLRRTDDICIPHTKHESYVKGTHSVAVCKHLIALKLGRVIVSHKAGATVYALKNHAKFLAKELLVPSGKGTDASNCHDEEAQDEEFSDDEQVTCGRIRILQPTGAHMKSRLHLKKVHMP